MSLRYGNADNKPAGGGKSGLGLACVSVAVGADTDGMVKFGLGAWGRSGRKTGTGLLRGFFRPNWRLLLPETAAVYTAAILITANETRLPEPPTMHFDNAV